MDAFAENQMGREPVVPPSPNPAADRRRDRMSKEVIDVVKSSGSVVVLEDDAAQELMSDDMQREVVVDLISETNSRSIAQRWDRKKSSLLAVGDPYAEPDGDKPFAKRVVEHYCTCSQALLSLKKLILYLFPVVSWLPKINKGSFCADCIAGLTVGVMLIPQSMSYANIAGLQYEYGLYTSVLPIITYALMGSSRQLGVGPVAMISLLVEVGLQGVLDEEECPAYYAQANVTSVVADWVPQYELCPHEYAKYAFLTSFLVGLFQVGAGILQLGFLVSFLAHPVISGFTSAAAIIIGLSQLQYFFGFSIPKSQYVYETIGHLINGLGETKYEQLLLGLAWWFMLWYARRLSVKQKKRFGWLKPSAPLITCVLAIIICANWSLFNGCGFKTCDETPHNPFAEPTKKYKEYNKYIVGFIPQGITAMGSIHKLKLSNLGRVVPTAISCSVIGFMESIAIAKSLAAKHKYQINPGQELVSLGVANVLGSITSAYPVTGSFSRSAVNNQVGAQTQLAGLITGLLLLITILALTPLFYFLPKFALAAIVIASVTNLIDYNEAIHLWKVKKQDLLLWMTAFIGTLFLGVQVGLLTAVGLSLVLVIWESVRPQMTVLWRLPNTTIYRNIKQESVGNFVPGVIIVRIGSSMYFANVAFIRDYISKMVQEFTEAAEPAALAETSLRAGPEPAGRWVSPEPIKYFVIEMTPVTSIDSTAVHMLDDMQRDLKDNYGIRIAFSTINTRVHDTLKRAGLISKLGEEWFHLSVHSAVQHCIRHKRRAAADEVESAQAGGADTPPEVMVQSVELTEGSGLSSVGGKTKMVSVQMDVPSSAAGGAPSSSDTSATR